MAYIAGDLRGITNDSLAGTKWNDYMHGWSGNDVLSAAGGNDIVFGDGGNDTLLGGDGFDILIGGPGNDLIIGGADRDQACYSTQSVRAKWEGGQLKVWNQYADPAQAARFGFGGDGLDTLIDVELLNLGGYLFRTQDIPNDNQVHLVGIGAEGTCFGFVYNYTGA